MAFATRSFAYAFIKEDTAGVLKDPTAATFTAVREGAALSGAVETTQSDEIRNSIGASKSFVTKEAPTGTIPKYIKTSGSEGVAPDYSVLIESCVGTVDVETTEYTTAASSTAGDATTRASIKVTPGDEANFAKGKALLIKDGTNGYAVRNIYNGITSGALPLAFNLGTAPGAGVGLGKSTFYAPENVDQPKFSAHGYQSSSSASAVYQAIAGCQTTSMTMTFPANELATFDFEIGGIKYYQDPIRIESTNSYIDFTDSAGTVAAQISAGVYQTPIHLADEIASKMTAASVGSGDDTITCTYSAGLFTIASDGSTLSLLFTTGGNAANSIDTTIGFAGTDETGALTYTSATEQTHNPAVTPAYDDADAQIVRDSMLLLGDQDDYICFPGSNLVVTVSAPKTDVPSWCAESGVDESLTLSREVTVSGTLKFTKHDVSRVYKLLNNETVQLAFTMGQKTAGNWTAGTIANVYLPEVSISTEQIADNDGYIVEEFEGTAIVGANMEDIYINFL